MLADMAVGAGDQKFGTQMASDRNDTCDGPRLRVMYRSETLGVHSGVSVGTTGTEFPDMTRSERILSAF